MAKHHHVVAFRSGWNLAGLVEQLHASTIRWLVFLLMAPSGAENGSQHLAVVFKSDASQTLQRTHILIFLE